MRSILAPLLSGILLALAWPVHGIPLLLFVALVPLFWLEEHIRKDGASQKGLRFFMLSWSGFLLFNALTTWWVWNSTSGGAILAIVCNALFMALVFLLYFKTAGRLGAFRGKVSLVFFWLAFEYAHLNWDLSWPWLQLGNGFAAWYPMIQWYEWTGVMGGTLWVLVANMLVWKALRSKPRRVVAFVPSFLVILLPTAWSLIRYVTWEDKGPAVEVVAVQPNIDPYTEKFKTSAVVQAEAMTHLAQQAIGSETRLVLFPETAVPSAIWHQDAGTTSKLRFYRALMENWAELSVITGVYYIQTFPSSEGPAPLSAKLLPNGDFVEDYNSALQLNPDGSQAIYHKSKLVPGPETFPFAEVLKPFQETLLKNIHGVGDMGKQKERSVFPHPTVEGLVAAPVICYESVYGDFVTEYMRKGASCITVITNDAWWGDTPGHKQLLAYTRLRAIENRRSVARSANTGISGFINQRGDSYGTLGYLQTGWVRDNIQLNSELTLYTRSGDWMGRLCLLLAPLLWLYGLVHHKLKK